MRFFVPARPSMRNQLIYAEVVTEGQDQWTVASHYGISQSQVSRICKQVRTWLVRKRTVDESLSVEEATWIANREYIEQLQVAQRKALEVFEHGIPEEVETRTRRGSDVETVKIQKKHVGVGDARMLAAYTRAARDLREARIDEAKAAQFCAARLSEMQTCQEDMSVVAVEDVLREGRKLLKRAAKHGYPTPLPPKMSRAEVIAHARKTFREQPELNPMQLLPQEWQYAIGQAFFDPDIIAPETKPAKRRRSFTSDAYDPAKSAPACIDAPAEGDGATTIETVVSAAVTRHKPTADDDQKRMHKSRDESQIPIAAAG